MTNAKPTAKPVLKWSGSDATRWLARSGVSSPCYEATHHTITRDGAWYVMVVENGGFPLPKKFGIFATIDASKAACAADCAKRVQS